MKKIFACELIIGIIGFAAVAIFGEKGMVAMALYIYVLFIDRKKMDEREYQLFYRVGNITAGLTLLACLIIYEFSDLLVNGYSVGKNWLFWVLYAFFIAHGAAGLFVFRKNNSEIK